MKHAHARRFDLPFVWPDPPLHVVLVSPEIPPNTGNVARTCAATGSQLHLIEPMGFTPTDAKLKRAGLDYWDSIKPEIHPNFAAFVESAKPKRMWFFSTAGSRSYFDVEFAPGDALVFGSETSGLADDLLKENADRVLGVPIRTEHVRSLNLSTVAGIVVFEALRQIQTRSRS